VRRSLPLLGFLLLILCSCKVTKLRHDGEDPPRMTIPVERASSTPVIDGRLDEAVWKTAAQTPPFVNPSSGGASAGDFGGTARLAADATFLLVAFDVTDPAPISPFGPQEDDPHIWSRASGVELMIQPCGGGDNRHYFELQVDVNGALWDTHFDDYNRPRTRTAKGMRYGHQRWRSGTLRAVRRTRSGYMVELAVPWRSLGFGAPKNRTCQLPPTPGDRWRMNLYVFRDGQRRAAAWSPLLGRGNFHRAERFGTVLFR